MTPRLGRPNNLIAGGACVIRDAQDVLDAMLGPGRHRVFEKHVAALEPDLESALAAVEAGRTNCDAVANATGLSASAAAATLARLKLLGYLACSSVGKLLRALQCSDSQTKAFLQKTRGCFRVTGNAR